VIDLAAVPGMVSVWIGPACSTVATFARRPDEPHYAASTMKVAVLAALYRSGFDLDADVPVVNDFASAMPGAARYANDPRGDEDGEVWARLGRSASLRWLARRMIVRSSNLATNIVWSHVGQPAVAEVLRVAGTTHSRIERGIDDGAARSAGIDNVVTARDLAALLGAIATSRPSLAPAAARAEMVEVLLAQERRDDLTVGLPPGTRVAYKNGWVNGVRHSAGVVFPQDAPAYVIAVCTTTSLPDRDACAVIAKVAAASWVRRSAPVR
jgi:beta-lactamase class A